MKKNIEDELGGVDAGSLDLMMTDEPSRLPKFVFDMLVASLRQLCDDQTRLAIVGDPCQIPPSSRVHSDLNQTRIDCSVDQSTIA